jgi:hypothetical protein
MKKLFSLDCHCSTTTDLQWMAKQWGDLQIDEWLMSHHCHYVGKTRFCPPMLENGRWRDLDEKMVDEFYATYKDEFKDYDGFIVNYPFPFCLLWEKFEKPIYANICIRYEYPFSWDEKRRDWLHERVDAMLTSGQLRINANNAFDAAYFQDHTKHSVHSIIPNLCAYTEAKYAPKRNHFWVHSKVDFEGKDKIGSPFPKNHKWQDIADGLGIFFVPYNVSVMSFFEWYTAGIPICIPTRRWMKELGMPELYFNGKFSGWTWDGVLDMSDFYSGAFPHLAYADSAMDFMQNVTIPKVNGIATDTGMLEDMRRNGIMFKWRNFLFDKKII